MAALMVNMGPRHGAPGPSTCSPFYRHHPWKERTNSLNTRWARQLSIARSCSRGHQSVSVNSARFIFICRCDPPISGVKSWHVGLEGPVLLVSAVSQLCYEGHINKSESYLSTPLLRTAFGPPTDEFDKKPLSNSGSRYSPLSRCVYTRVHTHQPALACTHPYNKALYKRVVSPPFGSR